MHNVGSWNADIIIEVSDNLSFRLDGRSVAISGITYDNSVTASGDFSIGNVVIPKLTLKLLNYNGEFDRYGAWDEDSNGHYIIPESGDGSIRLSEDIIWEDSEIYRCNVTRMMENGSEKSQSLGTFTVQSATENGGIITITAYGQMEKLDDDYDGSEPGLTLQSLYAACCQKIGATADPFPENSFTLQYQPEDCTWREVLSAAVELVGLNVLEQSSVDGSCRLSLVDYDESSVDADVTMMSLTSREKNPIAITGVKASYNPGGTEFSYQRGNDAFSIDISDNLLLRTELQKQENAIKDENPNATYDPTETLKRFVDQVATKFLDSDDNPMFSFTPFSGSFVSVPGILPGQTVRWKDQKGHSQKGIAMNVTLTCGGAMKLSSSTPQKIDKRKSSIQNAIAQGQISAVHQAVKESSRYEQAADNLNKLTANALGYYQTVEEDDEGRKITYLHDKPTLENSTNIWRMAGSVFSISTDGGKTYSNGVSVDGSMVMNLISVVGLNAEWITTGILQSHSEEVYINLDTGEAYVPKVLGAVNETNYVGMEQGTMNISGANYIGMRFYYQIGNSPGSQTDYFYILRNGSSVFLLPSYSSGRPSCLLELSGATPSESNNKIFRVRLGNTMGEMMYITNEGNMCIAGEFFVMGHGTQFVDQAGTFVIQKDGQILFRDSLGTTYLAINKNNVAGVSTDFPFSAQTVSSESFNMKGDPHAGLRQFSNDSSFGLTFPNTTFLRISCQSGENSYRTIVQFDPTAGNPVNFFQGINMNGWQITNAVIADLSDESVKKYISDSNESALDIIEQIKMRKYTYRTNAGEFLANKKVRFGEVANELEEVFPEAVVHGSDGLSYIDKSKLIDLLLKGLQEANEKIKALEAKMGGT